MTIHKLFLYSYIDEYEARALVDQLNEIVRAAAVSEGASEAAAKQVGVALHIHSPGGEVYSGFALYHQLQALKAQGLEVTVYIDGLAASMAGIVAMAGGRICMARHAQLMVHNPWAMAQGDSATLRRDADQLEAIRKQLIDIYQKRTGLSSEELSELMDDETYLTAEEAFVLGFVDEVTDGGLGKPADEAVVQACSRPMQVYNLYTDAIPELPAQRVTEPLADEHLAGLPKELQAALKALHAKGAAETRTVLAALAALQHSARPSLMASLRLQRLQAQGTMRAERRADWTIRRWEKEDPEGLAQLKTDDPVSYQALFRATYGEVPC